MFKRIYTFKKYKLYVTIGSKTLVSLFRGQRKLPLSIEQVKKLFPTLSAFYISNQGYSIMSSFSQEDIHLKNCSQFKEVKLERILTSVNYVDIFIKQSKNFCEIRYPRNEESLGKVLHDVVNSINQFKVNILDVSDDEYIRALFFCPSLSECRRRLERNLSKFKNKYILEKMGSIYGNKRVGRIVKKENKKSIIP